jgi:cytochrome c-type biogenesis protein CcmF
VLSVGNFLGGWWAYTVLGWGGYWGWDPVENSAILPLLPMTAFLHSMMVQERRGMLKLWNLALVTAAFALAVFGTFNVRSGLVESVHSFAQSDVGAYFLILVGVVVVASIGLLAWRAQYLKPDHDFDSLLSRESGLILNNYLLTAIALVILGGTLFPVFSELFDGSRVTVGPSFYNRVVGPLLIALVALIAIGTVLPWRRAAGSTLVRRFRAPVILLVASLVVLAVFGMHDPFALAGTSAAIVLFYVTVREFVLGARGARAATGANWLMAFFGLFDRDRRRYGGYLVHIGFAVMAIAVVGSTIYQQQVRTTVAPGESFEVGGRTLTYEGLRERQGTANGIESEIVAPVTISEDGEQTGRLEPGRRLFTNFPQQPTALVAVDSSLRDDLYVFVQGWDDNGVAEFHVFVNPLITWLWIGGAIYVVGGLLAFAPQRANVAERRELPSEGMPQRV